MNRDLSRPVDLLADKLSQELARVPVRINRRSTGELAAPVQPFRIRHADFDPSREAAGKVAHTNRGFVPSRDSFCETDPFTVLKAVGQYPGQHEFGRFGRLARYPQVE